MFLKGIALINSIDAKFQSFLDSSFAGLSHTTHFFERSNSYDMRFDPIMQ